MDRTRQSTITCKVLERISLGIRAPLINIHGFATELEGSLAKWRCLSEDDSCDLEGRELLETALRLEVEESLSYLCGAIEQLRTLTTVLSSAPPEPSLPDSAASCPASGLRSQLHAFAEWCTRLRSPGDLLLGSLVRGEVPTSGCGDR